eukprot:3614931-Alexandrium_andersonii.AAC.1
MSGPRTKKACPHGGMSQSPLRDTERADATMFQQSRACVVRGATIRRTRVFSHAHRPHGSASP